MSNRAQQPSSEPPRQTNLILGALPSAVASARSHVRAVALTWGLDKEPIEIAVLLVSEIVTNGISAESPKRMPQRVGWLKDLAAVIELRFTRHADRVTIEVWDANPYPPPKPGPLDEQAEHGRGLFLVDQLSARWGWYHPALCSEVEPPVLGFGRFQPAPRLIEMGQRLLTGKVVWCEVATAQATGPAAS